MPSIKNNLIIVKGKDKTDKITSFRFEQRRHVVWLRYGAKEYPYNTADVLFFKNPRVFNLGNRLLLKNGTECPGADVIQDFGQYSRIIYKSGYTETVYSGCLSTLDSALSSTGSRNCFEYLKQLAGAIGLKAEDGHNILLSRYEKINFIREDSVMASFLSGRLEGNKIRCGSTSVFPFGFNISQKKAVDNALNNRLSIIEGPPGTGKTQTILNIIANAVTAGESVAVVSSNNSAAENVLQKLRKYGVGFIAAYLGNTENKNDFINNQKREISGIGDWKLPAETLLKLEMKLKSEGRELDRMLSVQNELSSLNEELDSLKKEKDYFNDLSFEETEGNPVPVFSKKKKAGDILTFLSDFEYAEHNNISLGFIGKLKWKFRYGLRDMKFLKVKYDDIYARCYKEYYARRLKEIEKAVGEADNLLKAYDFGERMENYSKLSMLVFRAKLAAKYRDCMHSRIYSQESLRTDPGSFIKDYPVVLSTCYSLSSSLSNNFIYDYVIIDEASQADLAAGALALSCARKAVIVGDTKQLPNVVNPEDRHITDRIFEGYGLPDAYRYSDHSLLTSVKDLFDSVPCTLLREHYRCHPEIIGFCNRRFYNNGLIVLTKPKSDREPLMIYRTPAGNHARGRYNQRQIDVIKEEVIPGQGLDPMSGDIGIVTPYRDQADALQKAFEGTRIKADTADKFQGQERSTMIFSTVDNKIGDFASDPNRLNVAVSRAIDQFIVVTDGNDNDSSSPIHELIGYIKYHNHTLIDSKVSSVFDSLYRDAYRAREKILHKYGKVSEYESENLMYGVIKNVLSEEEFTKYGTAAHVPLRLILKDLKNLDVRELSFAANHLTHVDFLIFSKLTRQPVLVIEVDGFAYHAENEKQKERDSVKDRILGKYGIPIVRFSTVGSGESEKLEEALRSLERDTANYGRESER